MGEIGWVKEEAGWQHLSEFDIQSTPENSIDSETSSLLLGNTAFHDGPNFGSPHMDVPEMGRRGHLHKMA